MPDPEPLVAILLCTKDGAEFLDAQLESIATQTHRRWILIASDDGSSDATRDLLGRFARSSAQSVIVRDGPQRGACANFISLAADPTVEADYFAYADQDDIWYPDKLETALRWLATLPQEKPAVFCSRTELIRRDGEPYGFSPLFAHPPDFRNALIQSIGGGNTMVFNRAAKRLLEQVGPIEVVAHDWWTYQLVTAAGGTIHYAAKPTIKYRQHGNNLVGSNLGWHARLLRVRMMLSGRFGSWNEINIRALKQVPPEVITPRSKMVLKDFVRARSGWLGARLFWLWRSGVYRQTLLGNLGLVAATVLRRI